jgi:hypothetical protein
VLGELLMKMDRKSSRPSAATEMGSNISPRISDVSLQFLRLWLHVNGSARKRRRFWD